MAQRRRNERLQKQKDQRMVALCVAGGVAVMALSLILCLIIFGVPTTQQTISAAVATPLPYDASAPFSISDLTSAQLSALRKDGRMHVSDGPRGVSIGDSLDKLLERYPSTGAQAPKANEQTSQLSDEEMTLYYTQYLSSLNPSDQTGLQSDEEVILYCAEYFENQNGVMTALPPRGLLNVQGGRIVVTLLAPTFAYPAGTKDSYGSYEHVYCVYTIEPETMTVSSIELGIDK